MTPLSYSADETSKSLLSIQGVRYRGTRVPGQPAMAQGKREEANYT